MNDSIRACYEEVCGKIVKLEGLKRALEEYSTGGAEKVKEKPTQKSKPGATSSTSEVVQRLNEAAAKIEQPFTAIRLADVASAPIKRASNFVFNRAKKGWFRRVSAGAYVRTSAFGKEGGKPEPKAAEKPGTLRIAALPGKADNNYEKNYEARKAALGVAAKKAEDQE